MRHRISRLIPTVLSGGGGGVAEINVTNPTITPTLGSELVTNGGFDSDTSGWTVSSPGTFTSTAGGQSGNGGLIGNNGGTYQYAYQQQPTLTVGEYYLVSFYQYSSLGASGGSMLFRWGTSANGTQYCNSAVSNGSWTQKFYVIRATSATSYIAPNVNSTGATSTTGIDTVSCKLLSATGLLLGDIERKNGTYICHPTVAQYSIAGMDINYLDADNLVRMELVRNGDVTNTTTARLFKRISGTWTSVISAAVTYSAGAELKAIVSGTTFQLWYNGTQVGTDQTIDNSGLGTKVYAFNTLAGNTLGACTTNP